MAKHPKKNTFFPKKFLIIISGLVMLNIALLFFFIHASPKEFFGQPFTEIKALENGPRGFDEIAAFFRDVAKKKGAAYAFDLMKVAPIPPDIDVHLLAHEVGDILYKQQGADGVAVCTDDFRNACSHTIVVGLFREKGEAALPLIAEACHHAPGGTGAYTMCFHGLGHGILAATGYDLKRTVGICKKTGTSAYNKREYPECVGGAIMELTGGVHDPVERDREAKKYMTQNNPLSPCNRDFMDDAAGPVCYIYLTPHLFELAGVDIGNPLPQYFAKAFAFCSQIHSQEADRDACFGGFGKEFIGIVRSRDARKSTLQNMDSEKLSLIYTWCMKAGIDQGKGACLFSAASSLYWGGENGEELPLSFCSIIGNETYRDQCFGNLIGALHFYKSDPAMWQEACKKFPAYYQEQCNRSDVR